MVVVLNASRGLRCPGDATGRRVPVYDPRHCSRCSQPLGMNSERQRRGMPLEVGHGVINSWRACDISGNRVRDESNGFCFIG